MKPNHTYLITFRTYGTWLHGDAQGSVDRHHAKYASPLLKPDAAQEIAARQRMRGPEFRLEGSAVAVVHAAVCDVLRHRQWRMHALNVRTTHVHLVVTAPEAPERVMNSIKAWATRRLRESLLVGPEERVWSRHGSTRWLFDDCSVAGACDYVMNGQGDDLTGRALDALLKGTAFPETNRPAC